MNPVRKRKLITLFFFLLIISVAWGLILYALRQNISLFYSPSQVIAGEAPQHRTIHLGGMVEKNSIIRAQKELSITFKITDFQHTINVAYTGILPDLFKEGQGVVAEGELIDKQLFQASRVLAKHDENYMPPEVKAALAQQVRS